MFMSAVALVLVIAQAEPPKPGVAPSQIVAITPEAGGLGTSITVAVENPPKRNPEPPKKWILYFDGIPLKGIHSESSGFQPVFDKNGKLVDNQGQLKFRLDLTKSKESQEVWLTLVKSEPWDRKVTVQLGSETEIEQSIGAYAKQFTLHLRPERNLWFAGIGVGLLFVILVYLATTTSLLRNSDTEQTGSVTAPYSLGLTQMTFWFFLVFVAYIYIGIVTWNFKDTVTPSVLVLMGISTATALGSISIDRDKRRRRNALVGERTGLEAEVSALESQIGTAAADLKSLLAEKKTRLDEELVALSTQIGAVTNDPKPSLIEKKSKLEADIVELTNQIEATPDTDTLKLTLIERKRGLELEVAAVATEIEAVNAAADLIPTLVEKKRGLEVQVAALATQIGTATDGLKPALAERKSKKEQRLNEIADILASLPQNAATTKGFYQDLLRDEVGISLDRLQMVSWTFVLGGVFVTEVIRNLAMPEFSETLLALMGISSGTYVGFKVTERKP